MTHYVYRLEDGLGGFYFGSRSTTKDPSSDPYMGSGTWPRLCKGNGTKLKKTIIRSDFKTRIEASRYEVDLIVSNKEDPMIRNISTTIQDPIFGKNPFSELLSSGLIALGELPVLAYLTLIGRDAGLGISSYVLSRYVNSSIEECDAALASAATIKSHSLPTIEKQGNIWRIGRAK